MNIPLAKNGIKCEWMLELINAKTGEVDKTIPWQKNTILDTGMAYFIKTTGTCYGLFKTTQTDSGYFNSIAVGSGTTTPTFTDTVLESFITAKAYDYTLGSAHFYSTDNATPGDVMLVTSFNENEANGTIAEMGLLSGTTNTAGKYFCRNRLVDVDGNPTTIVKDDAHLLKISAKITINRIGNPFASVPITEIGGLGTANNVVSFMNTYAMVDLLLGGSYGPYSIGSAGVNATSAALDISSGLTNYDYMNISPSVSGSATMTRINSGKTGDDYWIDFKYEIPQTSCNMEIKTLTISNPIKSGAFYSWVKYPSIVCIFETPLPKDSTKKLYITFRHTWTRS